MSDLARNYWQGACDAAEGIRDEFGLRKAIGYLVGEKLLTFIEESGRSEEVRRELPRFVQEVRRMFSHEELEEYFATVRRVGALGHVMSDAEYEVFREADGGNNPVDGARYVLLVERAKELLGIDTEGKPL